MFPFMVDIFLTLEHQTDRKMKHYYSYMVRFLEPKI